MLPLNLYARVRTSYVHLAHETAGAARTRSSLLPLFEGRGIAAKLGRITPREGKAMFVNVSASATHSPSSPAGDDE